MKHLLCLSVVAVAVAFMPKVRAADPAQPVKSVATDRAARGKIIVRGANGRQTIYHLTDTELTGSHIPVVIRQTPELIRPMDNPFRRNDKPGGSLPNLVRSAGARTVTRSPEISYF